MPAMTVYKLTGSLPISGNTRFLGQTTKCKLRDMQCNKTGNAKRGQVTESPCTDPVTHITDPICALGMQKNDAA